MSYVLSAKGAKTHAECLTETKHAPIGIKTLQLHLVYNIQH